MFTWVDVLSENGLVDSDHELLVFVGFLFDILDLLFEFVALLVLLLEFPPERVIVSVQSIDLLFESRVVYLDWIGAQHVTNHRVVLTVHRNRHFAHHYLRLITTDWSIFWRFESTIGSNGRPINKNIIVVKPWTQKAWL